VRSSGEFRDLIGQNPWLSISRSSERKYLEQDEAPLLDFNKRNIGKPTELRFELLPEPFVGTPNAPVWLLNLNPGFDEVELYQDEQFIIRQERNLKFDSPNFWYLDTSSALSPGGRYWQKKLSSVVKDCPEDTLSRNIFCLEFFPYHSKKFKPTKILPSQEFSAKLLRRAMALGKQIILLRSLSHWVKLVPELQEYPLHRLNSSQNISFTRKNCQTYDSVVARLAMNPISES
jgi:hypothetical protein